MKHQKYNTNMKKSAIDIYNSLPKELKNKDLNVSKSNPLKGFESLLNHYGMVSKVEVEDKTKIEIEDEVEDKIDNEKFYNVDTLENLYLKNDNIVNAVLNNKKLGFKNKEHLILRLGNFKASLQEVGRNQETFKEFCSYFRNWHLKTKNINPKGNTPFSNITF